MNLKLPAAIFWLSEFIQIARASFRIQLSTLTKNALSYNYLTLGFHDSSIGYHYSIFGFSNSMLGYNCKLFNLRVQLFNGRIQNI